MTDRMLYLHIGTPKTGTTALQNFFYINQDTLKSYGITYPLNYVWYLAHHRLGWSLNKKGRYYNMPADLKSSDQEWSDVLTMHGDKTLISSETFSRCNNESIRLIRQYTSGFDVKLVIYLRRQDGLINSIVNQMTKHASHTWTDERDAYDFLHERNYAKLLDSWAGVFGKENIVVRPYEKGQYHGGTIFADFLHHVFGLKLTDEFRLPDTDYNPRLHRLALDYKRLINHLDLAIEQKRSTIEPLMQFSRQLYAEGREDFDIFPPSQRLEIVQHYAATNAQVARQYLGREDGKLFCEPLPDPNKPWKPCLGLPANDIRRISRLIVEHDQALAKQVGMAIQAGLTSDEQPVHNAAKTLKAGLDTLLSRRTPPQVIVSYCRKHCMRAMRFVYHKLSARAQLAVKKIACKLKINP